MPRVQVTAGTADPAVVELELDEGATLLDAVRASRLAPDFDPGSWAVGVFGERRDAGSRLRDGDRVEVYRPLPLDPREMRRRAARRR